MRHSTIWAGVLASAVLSTAPGQGQDRMPRAVADYPAQTAYPREDTAGVARKLARARAIAGSDLWSEFRWRCLVSPLDRVQVQAVQHDGLVPPTRIFDNVYSVGQNAVSAFALDTPDGIILLDALNNADEARNIIVPNLTKLGLDPRRIRYVIVTHGHGDHYGGAAYLQQTYGARVVASAADWELMARSQKEGPFAGLVPPRRDIVAADGDRVTLGGTDVRLYVTPGHTPGTLSLIFPVRSGGKTVVAGMMGGTGGGQTPATIRQQIASLDRWQTLTRAAGATVLLTNHPSHMDATERQALVRYARAGDANPFVYGAARYRRYMQLMAACSRVQLARLGERGD